MPCYHLTAVRIYYYYSVRLTRDLFFRFSTLPSLYILFGKCDFSNKQGLTLHIKE